MNPTPCRTRLTAIIRTRQAQGLTPYLLIDGSWQKELALQARDLPDALWEPLMGYDMERKEDIHPRSPLVVDITDQTALLDAWLASDFPQKQGIVVFSKEPIATMRRSLKRFMKVITPDKPKPSLFRFYDPTVLYCFLRSGFSTQWADFFRDMHSLVMMSEFHEDWVHYRFKEDALHLGVTDPATGNISERVYQGTERDASVYRAYHPWKYLDQAQVDEMAICSEEGLVREVDQINKRIQKGGQDYPEPLSFDEIRHFLKVSQHFKCTKRIAKKFFCIMGYVCHPQFYKDEDFVDYMRIQYRWREELLGYILQNIAADTNNDVLAKLTNGVVPPLSVYEQRQTHLQS